MTIKDVLDAAGRSDVHLYLDGDTLKYKAPSGGLPDALRQRIREHRAGIVDYLKGVARRAAEPEFRLSPIVAAGAPERAPLSFAQQRLWVLDQVESGSSHYNMPGAVRLSGTLDKAALRAALQRIVERHAVLRSSLHSADGEVYQQVHAQVELPLREFDLSPLPPPARAQAAAERLQQEAAAVFDLGQAPLLRVALLTLAADEHLLSFNFHHIVFDAWSYGVVIREFSQLYAAFAAGRADPLPPLPLQYADYALWQRDWLRDEVLQRHLAYWTARLHGAPPVHALPLDRPRPRQQSFAGARHSQRIDAELGGAINALCQRAGATLFITLETAFALLLSRYSNENDIVVGTPIAGRAHQAVECLAGFFVNTLALRSQFDDAESFETALRNNRASIVDAFTYQHLPFEALVEALQPERSLAYSPLFQVLFSLQNNETGAVELPGLVLAPVAPAAAAAKFELELSVAEWNGGLELTWTYNTDLFDAATIERLGASFDCLLRGIVADPSRPLCRLPLVAEADRALLHGWAAGAEDFPRDCLVHELFYRQAQAAPERIAVVCRDASLSYAELNRRSNRLARHLQAQGVGRGSAVGLCTERGLDMIVAMLAILKAGAAYVPVDPNYPADRIAYMLTDSAAVVLLTQRSLVAELGAPALPLFLLDGAAEAGLLTAQDDADLALPADADPARDLANLIYTSGSTGLPKGVMVPHLGIARLVSAPEYVPLDADCVMLHASSPSFDVSTFEIWGALLNGGKLVIYPERHIDTAVINAQVAAHQINTMWLTASLFEQWSFETPVAGPLRWVLAGGDVVSPAAVLRVHRANPAIVVINGYGPTENTVFTCCHRVPRSFSGERPVPIGRPLKGTRNYVLSRHGELMPPGAIGELHSAGAGVARGYLNKPALSSEKFVADPFSADPDARLYRTGDLVRYLPDGSLEYLGRADNQVKLRGFRIELGEIESALNLQPGVKESVAVVREQQGSKFVVAYVAAPDVADDAAFLAGLREALQQRLPEFMQPARLLRLERLPLNPNGKVDKKALPDPGLGDYHSDEAFVAPSTPLQQQIAQVWQEVLGVERIGIQANFFEIGGHSLRAVQVVSRLRRALGVELAVRTLFEQPTVAGLAQAIAGAGQAQRPPVTAVARDGRLPLSWEQQRLWFIDQLDAAAGAAYHIPAGLRLRGALQRPQLRAALDRLVDRHEALRTGFPTHEGQPYQAIAPAGQGFALAEHDLRGLDPAQQAGAVAEHAAAEAAQRFDLARGPLIRGRLLCLAEDEHVLLITQHHIVSDAWSLGVLVREVAALYTAFVAGEADPLPPLPIQYGDYAAWQRQWLQGGTLQAQIAFWREHLDGAPVLIDLPTDRPRPPVRSFAGASFDFTLAPELDRGLRALAQRHDVTLHMVLLAAWGVALSRLSGQDDIVIGTPVANRRQTEVESLIGFFVNTLALRLRFDGAPDTGQLLAQVKRSLLDAYSHEELPFEQVVEAVQPPRSLSHSPLFQVTLALDNTPRDQALQLPELVLEPVAAPAATAHFDLSLALTDFGDGLAASLGYASDLFDAATAARFAACWQRVLQGMLQDEWRSVATIPLLDAQEQAALAAFNATAAPHRGDLLVTDLFAQQAAARADALAVVDATRRLSYAALERRANQLARLLAQQGAGRGARVAICLERGVDLVLAQLGVLKAGAAFVPLDPAYPRERLDYMLQDCAPALLITQASVQAALGFAGPSLLMDTLDLAAFDDSAVPPSQSGLAAAQPAYVIYTSGSTGQPKGVVNHHAGLSNLIQDNIVRFGLGPDSRMLQFASCSFDASVWEICLALCAGATLHLAAREELLPGAPLVQTLRARDISHVVLSPSALAALPLQAELPALRCVIAGGEALAPALAAQWAARCRLFNAYGPTEATVCSTVFDCNGESLRSVPIGRPLANVAVYILDELQQPVPIGVSGELYIGGIGVSHGYLGRDELTAQRFLPDPFAGRAGARMYRSGDLGRWRADGSIEYLGRCDFQVKLRGFRIELGEIEARLGSLPGVREAVVVVREDSPGDKRLVAYTTALPGAAPDAASLRAQLAAQLPEHMLPGAYVSLAQLPLTANGKLDRRSLPAPDGSALASRVYAAPQGAVEETLAAIWRQLLRVQEVGRHDHFFEIGGHSLLAVQLASQVRARLAVELPLRAVFEQPTIAGLATAIAAAAPAQQLRIDPVDRGQSLPLSWAQQRLWFLAQLDPAASRAYHIPIALRLRGALDAAALQAALDALVARHESLRTVFLNQEGRAVQVIRPAQPFALQRADLSTLGEAERQALLERHMAEESDAAFDLAAGPLARGRLLRLAADEHVLLLTQHHIVSDGWSVGVFVREVSALYTGFAQPALAVALPPLPLQYADYAAWQRQRVQDEALARQLAFWREHLRDAPGLLTLPLDRPRPATQSYRGAQVPVQVPAALAAGLRALAQRHDCTLFMVLLGSWALLLSRLSGQDDVVVGTPVANRGRLELEGLIGFFVNTLALRVRSGGDVSVAQLLAQIRGAAAQAYANQDLPFDQLVDALQPERSLGHSPLFQAMLTLDNTPPAAPAADTALQLEPLGLERRSTHFDISLALGAAGDGLAGSIDYASDLFDAATVQRWAGYWLNLLHAMVADAQQPAARLPLLDVAERTRLLREFNATAADFPRGRLIHEQFEARAAQQPDAIAVVCAGEHLSYAELNRRANQLARHLLALGLRADTPVALCLERSLDMVVAIVAVTKAGGAYLPVDVELPAERIAYMLENAQAPLLIKTAALLPGQRFDQVQVIEIDAAATAAQLQAQADTDIAAASLGLHARSLAYVIYTSGSTGRPKGVMVEHEALVNRIHWMQKAYALEPRDRVLQKTPYSFDVSVWEFWWTLGEGAALVMARPGGHRDPAYLRDVIIAERITTLHFVPSMLAGMLAAVDWAECRSVRQVFCSGEALDKRLVADYWRSGTTAKLHNLYGPTEAAIDVTFWDCARHAEVDTIPIGRPIDNIQIYILDPHGEPTPTGVAGELYIGGVGLARGYIGNAQLSAEKFVPNHLGEAHGLPGPRLYRTGDLARWTARGEVEYLGRIDNQIKLNGLRIELGEIESRLMECPEIREAVVLARALDARAGAARQLVAYVVPAGPVDAADADARKTRYRSQLREKLPEYMIPAIFVELAQMPVTANGKADRKALPSPAGADVQRREYVAPRTLWEQTFCRIWQEVLGLERIGIHDNYFELGGNSLGTVQIVGAARSAGITISVGQLFKTPTIAGLAELALRNAEESAAALAAGSGGATWTAAGGEGGEQGAHRAELAPAAEFTETQLRHLVRTLGREFPALAQQSDRIDGRLVLRAAELDRDALRRIVGVQQLAPGEDAQAARAALAETLQREAEAAAGAPFRAGLLLQEGRAEGVLLAANAALVDVAEWNRIHERARQLVAAAQEA
ncbi:non-ribosomal peptide synthetase [Tahibacter harae]|uniref:Amino acid adenylation domain-containing protein n=1 Tax=Tahibacter harae TaxID=2963937 RepID=A0ABT1QM41_9GAMM|nr:non-ribosomal peptide synthetase [Tahibacter harae]MCQ4163601.1 amino acid adenylation domain-containing protein [Tahibacter harae]